MKGEKKEERKKNGRKKKKRKKKKRKEKITKENKFTFFDDISTFVGQLMPKPSFLKNSSDTI